MNATLALEILKQTGSLDLFDLDVGHLLIQKQANSLFLVTQTPALPPLLVDVQQAEDFIHAHFAQVALWRTMFIRNQMTA